MDGEIWSVRQLNNASGTFLSFEEFYDNFDGDPSSHQINFASFLVINIFIEECTIYSPYIYILFPTQHCQHKQSLYILRKATILEPLYHSVLQVLMYNNMVPEMC